MEPPSPTTIEKMNPARPTILLLLMGLNEFVDKAFSSVFLDKAMNVEKVRVVKGERPSRSLRDYSGIVLSGSTFMVTDRHPWSVETGQLLVPLIAEGQVPILGVCYGHQLLADTLGGEVQFMKKRQIGTRECQLLEPTATDPLFSVFRERKTLNVTVLHRQSVVRLPGTAVLLASNDADVNHSVRFGRMCWGTQFHPEIGHDLIVQIVKRQKGMLAKDSIDYQTTLDSICKSNDGEVLLKRFADICKEKFKSKM